MKIILTKEVCVDLEEKYEKVKKLFEEDSKYDPENEPYASKYAAQQILLGMKTNVENLLLSQTPESNEFFKLTGMLGAILLYLCTISVETDELSAGLNYAILCRDTVKGHEKRPELVLISLNVLNELGLLWSEKEPKTGLAHLLEAEAFYKTIIDDNLKTYDIRSLFSAHPSLEDVEIPSDIASIEKLHTLTLYYSAQVYRTLKNLMTSAVYCHNTLKRQLQSKDIDHIDWALNAATLSQFFIENNGFKQARNHLAASSCVLKLYESQLEEQDELNEENQAKWEVYKHRSSDVARCWVKYGILLLSNSRVRLLEATEDIDSPCPLITDLSNFNLESNTVTLDDLAALYFSDLQLDEYENQISDQFVLTIEDAHKVFLNAKSWLDKAETYYTIDNFASDYIELVLDRVQLYFHLLFFEENPENRAKMHKRRVDLLENVLNQINPTYYMRYCRQMWYELAKTFVEILDIKLSKLKSDEYRPTAHDLSKVNSLVDKPITQFYNFINSFKDNIKKEFPKRIEEEYEKAFLIAYFQIGGLHGRYFSLDKRIKLERVTQSLEVYTKVVEYCQENPEAANVIKTEWSICKDMISVLPIKIMKITREIG